MEGDGGDGSLKITTTTPTTNDENSATTINNTQDILGEHETMAESQLSAAVAEESDITAPATVTATIPETEGVDKVHRCRRTLVLFSLATGGSNGPTDLGSDEEEIILINTIVVKIKSSDDGVNQGEVIRIIIFVLFTFAFVCIF